MNNDDMEGNYFGGGSVMHTVKDGEIYLDSLQVAQVLSQTGIRIALSAIRENNHTNATSAHMIMVIAEKVFELRSELLKRELDDALPDLGELDLGGLFD